MTKASSEAIVEVEIVGLNVGRSNKTHTSPAKKPSNSRVSLPLTTLCRKLLRDVGPVRFVIGIVLYDFCTGTRVVGMTIR